MTMTIFLGAVDRRIVCKESELGEEYLGYIIEKLEKDDDPSGIPKSIFLRVDNQPKDEILCV